MRNFTIYLVTLLCLHASKLVAQENRKEAIENRKEAIEKRKEAIEKRKVAIEKRKEAIEDNKEVVYFTFEYRAKKIAENIEWITREQKALLKAEVEEVNIQLEKGEITIEKANLKKQQLAQERAIIIENKVAVAQLELKNLVQEKVDGKITDQDFDNQEKSKTFKLYYGKKEISDNVKRKDSIREYRFSSRTSNQIVLAVGFNNLVTNGSIANSGFYYLRSSFFEWGLTFNTRLLKNNNLLHLKYGLTGVYSALYLTENRAYSIDNNQTIAATFPFELKNGNSYFKNVFVTIPVFLEFDFTKKKDGDTGNSFRIQRGFRFGLGGFVGYNTNSKQFLSYEKDGNEITERQKGDWNVNDWNYGLSTYVGYKSTSLYLKYDLNPLFQNNVVDQNNISLGIRFDFN